jgi:DNA-directed RNA polymerase subunit RPC12/RpoP
MIHFGCPTCGKSFQVKDKYAGKRTKCPKCGQAIQLLHPSSPATVLSQQSSRDPFAGIDGSAGEARDEGLSGSRRRSRQAGLTPLLVTFGSLMFVIAVVIGTLFATGVLRMNAGSSLRLGATRPQSTAVNPESFKRLYRVAKEIEGAQETGLNRADFGKHLQQFATELSIARDNVTSNDEKRVFRFYSEALEIWKDSAYLWDARISMPALRRNAEICRDLSANTAYGEKIGLSELCYEYTVLLIHEKLPIQSFPGKEKNALAVVAKIYNLPVKEEKGWRWINGDSFKELWLLASKKATAADNLAKGR